MSRKYHAGEGTQSKKNIDSSISLLKQKFQRQYPGFAAARQEREKRER